jgi:hypothetical protein
MAKPPFHKTVLISLGIATGLTSQPLFANDDSTKAEKPTEEALVVGKKIRAPTQMNQETERLLGIAGAATDPLQAIYALPGVTFASGDGPGGSEPVIRGSAPQDMPIS